MATGHSSLFDREDRGVIQLDSRGKYQGEAVCNRLLFGRRFQTAAPWVDKNSAAMSDDTP